jgi:hypothetical protein
VLESHGVPAFVARWIKDTSATGFLRRFEQPNKRVQDFSTTRLLCSKCEQRFSAWETQFAERLFKPYHDGRSRFEYEEWLLLFAASLAWRCLATVKREHLQAYPRHIAPFDEARNVLGAFLLKETAETPPYRHNLFFTPAGARSRSRLPEGLSWYFLRGADVTPVYSERRIATYVKLPGMFFWTSIVPPDPGGWRGTRIGRHGTVRAKNQILNEPSVGEFLMDRVQTLRKKFEHLSEVQQQRIDEAVRRNPERAAQSRSFDAWLDDERIKFENRMKPG